jgi:plasmid stabilization system protein ParE
MAEYRLTEGARADLINIYDFTESKFGSYQADGYYAGLDQVVWPTCRLSAHRSDS